MHELDENGHADYPHHPGTLPDCPACDLMEAYETWKEIKRGKRCPLDVLNEAGLNKDQRRLVETALRAEEESESEAIPVVDILHRTTGLTSRVKAQVAEWVDPNNAGQFRGTLEERDEHRKAADQRELDRRDDRVLEVAAQLDQDDHGPTARQVRETAASIRDHREMRHRREMWKHEDAEEELLAQARAAYKARDEIKALAQMLHNKAEEAAKENRKGVLGKAEEANQLWQRAAEQAVQIPPLTFQGDDLVSSSIEERRQARWHQEQADAYGNVNRAYEASETYRLDRSAEQDDDAKEID